MTHDDKAQLGPAVVLLSGGLDSMVTAAIARERGHALHALSIDYGQRHRRELESAQAIAERLGVERHVLLEGGNLRQHLQDIPHVPPGPGDPDCR